MLKKTEAKFFDGSKAIYTIDDDGGLQGICEEYDKNGRLEAKFTYKDGIKEGPYEEYYPNGQLKEKCAIKDNKYDGPYESYHENGQLKEKCAYQNGKMYGLYEQYYQNGQLSGRCTFKNDEYDGSYESYHENGQLKRKCTYKEGQIDGVLEEYDENGKLKENLTFQNGRLLGGQAAEEYREKWKKEKRENLLQKINERLNRNSDLDAVKKTIKPAQTPERTNTLARIMRVRRARDILAAAAESAKADKDKVLWDEITDIAQPYKARYEAILDKFHAKQVRKKADRE